MERDTQELVDLMLDSGVLTLGDFVGKSGRRMPYFINAGRFRTGAQVRTLGRLYARRIVASGVEFDVLFGPAYKGIPLAVAIAISLLEDFGRDVAFCFNRKEAKDHGEGGILVGHALSDGDRVLIVEDVTTAGSSVRESVPLLQRQAAVRLAGLVVSVDRQERGLGDKSALAELSEAFEMPCLALATIDDVIAVLGERSRDGQPLLTDDLRARIAAYRSTYGA